MAATVNGVVLTRLLLLLLLFAVASCTVPVVEAVQLLATVPKKIALPKIATMGTLSHAAATAAAAEAAAIVRHNMMSGATIFTVGDIAAQLFTMITAARGANDAKTSKDCTTTAVQSNNSDDDATTLAPTTASSTRTAAVLPHDVAIRRRLVQGKTLLLQLDVHRLATATFLGALYSGYAVPFVYGNVEACFPGRGNFQQICTKVLITCSILSTMGNYATLFARRFIAEALLVMANKNKNKTNKKTTTTSTSTTNTHDNNNNNNNNNRNHLDTDTTSSSSFSSRLKLIQSQIGTLLRHLVRTVLLFGRIFQNCYQSCNQDILKVIRDDLKIWPIYDFTCYSYIQPCYRPLTTSIMSSGWAMYMSIVSAKEQQQQQQQYEHELIQVHRNDDENDDEDRNKTMECIQKEEQKQKQYNDVEIAATIIETDISSITTTADNNNGDDENETNKVSASSSSSSIAETIATTMISNTDTNGTGTSIDCPAISFSDNNPVQQRKNNRISLSKQLGVASH